MRPRLLLLLVAAACGACSASSGPTSVGNGTQGGAKLGGTVNANQTWNDGLQLTSSVTIAKGVTVTIAPGASIHAASSVLITVDGTLQATGGAEASISGTDPWAGILVDQGATLALVNVDLENASGAISVNAGAAAARYDSGTITASAAPFAVEAGAKLTTAHAFVKGSLGTARVQGELDATYLDYDANGNDGITTEADGAVLSIEDSELHGIGGDSDMIVSYLGASLIHVAYTEIKNVHCGFHIQRASTIDVSHVNDTGNSFGAMLYGSLTTGTRTFDSVNFDGEAGWGIDEQTGDVNGPIAITNSYFANNVGGDLHLQTGSNIAATSNATAPIADAKPR
jgi:hypothetical protein